MLRRGVGIIFRPFFISFIGVWLSVGMLQAGSAIKRDFETSGLFWGGFRSPSSPHPDDSSNQKSEIYLKSDLRLAPVGGYGFFVAYTLFSATQDRLNVNFENSQNGALGIEFQFPLARYDRFSFGAKYEQQRRSLSGQTHSAWIATADYSLYRQSDRYASPYSSFDYWQLILSGWGKARFPASPEPSDKNNLLVEGNIRVSFDQKLDFGSLIISPFLELGFSYDTQDNDPNNTLDAGFGLAVKLPVKDGQIRLAVMVAHETRRISGDASTEPALLFSWHRNF